MKILKLAALYLALLSTANAQGIGEVPLEGDMRKLVVHDAPEQVSEAAVETPDGATRTLADYEGDVVILNFWATWCAPCREEMPSLDAIEAEYGDRGVSVVPVATGRNSVEGIERFFAEEGVSRLPILLDPTQAMARQMAVLGLPVTVILDRDGREIARLTGGADWAGPEARRVIEAALGES